MALKLLSAAALFGAAAQGFLFDQPKATATPVLPLNSVVPVPTPPPDLRKAKARRSVDTNTVFLAPDNTCGYIDGKQNVLFSCIDTYAQCAITSSAGVGYIGCCDAGSCAGYHIGCIDRAEYLANGCGDACGDSRYLLCTATDGYYCNAVTMNADAFDVWAYYCATDSATLIDNVETTYSGETDGRSFTRSVIFVTVTDTSATDTGEPSTTDTDEPGTTDTDEPGTTETDEPGTTETDEPVTTETGEPGTTDTPTPTFTDADETGTTGTPTPAPTDTSTTGTALHTVPTEPPQPTPKPKPKSNAGPIAGGVVGGVGGAALIAGIFYFLVRRHNKNAAANEDAAAAAAAAAGGAAGAGAGAGAGGGGDGHDPTGGAMPMMQTGGYAAVPQQVPYYTSQAPAPSTPSPALGTYGYYGAAGAGAGGLAAAAAAGAAPDRIDSTISPQPSMTPASSQQDYNNRMSNISAASSSPYAGHSAASPPMPGSAQMPATIYEAGGVPVGVDGGFHHGTMHELA